MRQECRTYVELLNIQSGMIDLEFGTFGEIVAGANEHIDSPFRVDEAGEVGDVEVGSHHAGWACSRADGDEVSVGVAAAGPVIELDSFRTDVRAGVLPTEDKPHILGVGYLAKISLHEDVAIRTASAANRGPIDIYSFIEAPVKRCPLG